MSIPAQDLVAFRAAMAHRSRVLAEDLHQTVKAAAWFVARAAAAATKIAPKFRKLVNVATARDWRVNRIYAADVYKSDGSHHLVPVPGRSVAEAKQSPIARVPRRGLAKDAWAWILGAMGQRGAPSLNRPMPRAYYVQQRLTLTDPAILMVNKLRFGQAAFKTGGRATINNILARASRAMVSDADRRARKAAK
jgi:hypothetical protein